MGLWANTIRLPSGDQDGCPVNPLMWVILSMSLPSACMVYTCHAPVRSLSKTSSRPFGDQAAQTDWCFVDVCVS